MAENNAPQNMQDDELSVEELDAVAGGEGDVNNGCNFVAGCGAPIAPAPPSTPPS
jgi:hypothetical protein